MDAGGANSKEQSELHPSTALSISAQQVDQSSDAFRTFLRAYNTAHTYTNRSAPSTGGMNPADDIHNRSDGVSIRLRASMTAHDDANAAVSDRHNSVTTTANESVRPGSVTTTAKKAAQSDSPPKNKFENTYSHVFGNRLRASKTARRDANAAVSDRHNSVTTADKGVRAGSITATAKNATQPESPPKEKFENTYFPRVPASVFLEIVQQPVPWGEPGTYRDTAFPNPCDPEIDGPPSNGLIVMCPHITQRNYLLELDIRYYTHLLCDKCVHGRNVNSPVRLWPDTTTFKWMFPVPGEAKRRSDEEMNKRLHSAKATHRAKENDKVSTNEQVNRGLDSADVPRRAKEDVKISKNEQGDESKDYTDIAQERQGSPA
ncbi:hypothetical protein FPV67DRAFT_1682601 [Lyophyllum atratum]|nr:hypothetical protein FPV67DRAFT_1682601 [Lyophyllum atratum]